MYYFFLCRFIAPFVGHYRLIFTAIIHVINELPLSSFFPSSFLLLFLSFFFLFIISSFIFSFLFLFFLFFFSFCLLLLPLHATLPKLHQTTSNLHSTKATFAEFFLNSIFTKFFLSANSPMLLLQWNFVS